MAVQTKQFKQISYAALARDSTGTFGSTTLTAAAPAASATLTVAGITNFAVGDTIRIGSGEDTELIQVHPSTAPTGTTITLAWNTRKAHANAEPVVEQTVYDLGDVAGDGVEFTSSAESLDIPASTRRLTYAVVIGYAKAGMKFTLPGVSLYNFATAFGIPFARITSSGAVLVVTSLIEDGNNFSAENNMSLVVHGVLKDGTFARAELWGVDMDYTGVTVPMARGQAGGVLINGIGAGGGVLTTDATTYTLNITNRPGKGKVFDAVTEVGFFGSPGTPTTTAVAIAAADTNTVNLTAVTGMAAGDWVKYGAGELAEYHQIDSIAALVVTNRSKFLRAQAIGTVAVEVTPTAFSGVAPDGATFTVGGSVTPLRTAVRRFEIGLRAGNVQATFGFKLTDFSLSVFQQALALPAGNLLNNRLLFDNALGGTPVDGVYAKGTLLDGTTFWILCWGCSQDLASFAVQLQNAGEAPSFPLLFKPASGFAILNHA